MGARHACPERGQRTVRRRWRWPGERGPRRGRWSRRERTAAAKVNADSNNGGNRGTRENRSGKAARERGRTTAREVVRADENHGGGDRPRMTMELEYQRARITSVRCALSFVHVTNSEPLVACRRLSPIAISWIFYYECPSVLSLPV